MNMNYRKILKNRTSMMVGGVVLCAVLSGCGRDAEQAVEAEVSTPVQVQPLREMTFSRELHIQGTLESVHFALVPAKAKGSIERIMAEEGDVVTKGQPLCELDSENLRRRVESQEQELAVASNSVLVAEALAAKAEATHALAEKDHIRYRHLSDEQVVSVRQMDEVESRSVIASAALDVAVAQVQLSRARMQQAETALGIAQRNLEDTTVRAPIAGRISIRHREQGEMVHVGDPVFRIDDPSALQASIFASASAYGEVVPGVTVGRITLGDTDLGDLPVSYCSPTVDETLRTFEIKVQIDNPPAGIVAGGQADVRIVLAERQGRGVPADALQMRSGKTVAFVVKAGRAQQVEVQTGLRTEGFLEISAGLDGDQRFQIRKSSSCGRGFGHESQRRRS